ncbi:hypothetical protein IAU60_005691 [Kwoniella sp. DSM 27419]
MVAYPHDGGHDANGNAQQPGWPDSYPLQGSASTTLPPAVPGQYSDSAWYLNQTNQGMLQSDVQDGPSFRGLPDAQSYQAYSSSLPGPSSTQGGLTATHQISSVVPPQGSSARSSSFASPQLVSMPQSTSEKDAYDSLSTPRKGSADKAPDSGSGPSKKKRKKSQLAEKDVPRAAASPTEAEKEKEKRTKTGRACDACRTKKIRCDILPPKDSPTEDAVPICAHCKQYDLECTFFLPITETRFKKKRQAEENSSTDGTQPGLGNAMQQANTASHAESPSYSNMAGGANDSTGDRGRIEGPTSIAFLLHTTIPAIQSEAFDMRHHNSWEVLEDGNGLIRVNAPPSAPSHADADPQDPTRAHNRLNKPVLSAQTMSLLVNAYFNEVAPLFPIVSRAEFAARATPSPLLLYSICGLGATRRQFPREVFAGVRGVINGILRSNDILSDARFENVQALLLLAQVGDLHAQPTAATASASLIRTGAAIRMAQDLGLHRESSLRASTAQDLAYVELRRRVWATCVIMDRWYGAALGIPLLVDLLDCDVLLPAQYNISAETEPSSWQINTSFMALTEHLKLSILIGRVLKMIYSPTGLKHTTDAQLEGLVADMNAWKDGLPEALKFHGPSSSHVAGLLHLGYTGLQFLFWRVFMRITYSCPPHLTFVVQLAHWSKMVLWSREALEWLDKNDDALDTLFIFPYAATSCALIQYHTWARRADPDALETLKLVKETATRWEQTVQPDQMSIRRKTCETMTLLYEAALKTDPDSNENKFPPPRIANPTAGVLPRQGGFSKVIFHKDATMEGGGVFVASDEQERQASGLRVRDVRLASEVQPGQSNDVSPNGGVSSQSSQEIYNGQTQVDISDATSGAVLHNMVRTSSNVNPQINEDIIKAGPAGAEGTVPNLGHMMDINPEMASHLTIPGAESFPSQGIQNHSDNSTMPDHGPHPVQNGIVNGGPGGQVQAHPSGNFDPSFLDSLPVSTFDWESWSSYFDKFLPAANQSFETMQ